MTFQLPPDAARWRDRARRFAEEELRPFEIEAEMNEGKIAPEDRAAHRRAAIAMGLPLMDVPKSHGGLELPVLTQAAVTEQLGRITNALAWCYGEAQRWMFEACNEDQIARFILPLTRGEASSLLCHQRRRRRLRSFGHRHDGGTQGRSLSGHRREVACHQL